MASEATLGEVASVRSGYAFKSSSWKAEGFPVVKIKNVLDGVVSLEGCAYVGSGDVQKARDFIATDGDVLISLTGYVGQVGRVPKGQEVLVNQRVGLVTPHESEDRSYVYHLLRFLKPRVEALGTGTAQSNVAPRSILGLSIPSLSASQRRSIAAVLDEFDEKIRLNSLISQNLEGFASKLFRSWFIDIDPVKAKMAGEAPVGMDAETAELFPDSMEDSELGEIPSGWELRSLAEVVSVTKGRSYKSSELEESPVSLVTLKSFFRGGGYRKDGLKPFTGTFKDDQVVEPGELVMAFTDVTQAAELIGVPAIVQADPTAELLVASLDVGIVRPRSSFVPNPFIYFHLRSDSFRNHAKSHASGTTVLHLSKDAVPNFKLAMPPAELLQKFREISEPAFSLIDSLSEESRLLSETRDSLLPRLISGELEIPDEMLAA